MRNYFLYTLDDPTSCTPRYVGISNNPKRRFQEHLVDLSITNKTKWIKSLLIDNLQPILKIVAETHNVSEVIKWEKQYIRKYKEIYNLTNSTIGGEYYAIGTPIQVFDIDGNYLESYTSMIEYCELSNLRKTFVSSISAVCLRKRNYANNTIFRYIDDVVTSEDLIKVKKSLSKHPVKFYVLDFDGNIIKIYNTICSAVRDGLGNLSTICGTLAKKYTHCGNYLLCKDPSEYQERLLMYNRAKSFNTFKYPLNQYDLNGNYVNQFWTYTDAVKQFGTQCINIIRDCIEGKCEQAKGFYWRFAQDVNDKKNIKINISQNVKNKYAKLVQIDVQTKIILNIFHSKQEASKQLNISRYFVTDLLNGKKDQINGYTIKYDYALNKPLNIGKALA